MTSAQDVVERVVALLGWVGDVRIVPGGDGTEARIVHDAEAWWLPITGTRPQEPPWRALVREGVGEDHLACVHRSLRALVGQG
ncbi:hypothetical protein A6P39_045225 (plasmid) [Streptomyces sp. FXJ1.172]|nr:hypothetical protein [Streptomyces sp. FXJ1.172]WEP01051.1 hypothetical protein A6P39_045225 [Streptomyces sp. FXJ1.172]